MVPSNVQSARQEALLYVFEDNEAVIKMIMKGRSPTMRHVSRIHRVALDWLFDRINLDPKIQIKYIDTKNQLADILTKGNFTRDEWKHLLTLFNISHFSSTACIAAMAKRAQQESGEGRVTAKSRPMMNLTARTPSFVSSSASSNPGRTSYGYQDPERHVLDDRTGQPVETSRSDYLQKDYGLSWSSQEWKSGDGEHDRSGKPEENSWDILQKVDPHREEPLLGRNAHSARYGEPKKSTAGGLDGWAWNEIKALSLSWFVGLALFLRQIEAAGRRPQGLLDACIAMIPKAEGDSTPLGQRPCLTDRLSAVGLGSSGPSSGLVLFLGS